MRFINRSKNRRIIRKYYDYEPLYDEKNKRNEKKETEPIIYDFKYENIYEFKHENLRRNTKTQDRKEQIEYEPIEVDLSKYNKQKIDLKKYLINKIRIEENPMGKGRHDKAVYISKENGQEKRTSNIMLGKQQIDLPDGEYVSIEEAQRALRQYLEERSQENIVYKIRKGKTPYTNPKKIETLFAQAIKGQAKIKIGSGSEKIKNQDTASFLYKDKEKNEYIRKGLLFLGKGKLTLPSGEYISVQEIEKALEQYLVFEKKKEENEVNTGIVAFNDEENETYKVRDVQKNKFKLWPVITTAISNITLNLRNIRRRGVAYEER